MSNFRVAMEQIACGGFWAVMLLMGWAFGGFFFVLGSWTALAFLAHLAGLNVDSPWIPIVSIGAYALLSWGYGRRFKIVRRRAGEIPHPFEVCE